MESWQSIGWEAIKRAHKLLGEKRHRVKFGEKCTEQEMEEWKQRCWGIKGIVEENSPSIQASGNTTLGGTRAVRIDDEHDQLQVASFPCYREIGKTAIPIPHSISMLCTTITMSYVVGFSCVPIHARVSKEAKSEDDNVTSFHTGFLCRASFLKLAPSAGRFPEESVQRMRSEHPRDALASQHHLDASKSIQVTLAKYEASNGR
ncbi:hypothetical protein PGT21_020106 [Puccinia graminis f. sp. tritici]|uniref:Uncharacterized protein n=1 Tax=Puccinia graminis f. sp. tritici TaxID=56615 RepID=A0A5B0Q649_PUCGR|nr:hypothetical protein PGT21_020106 [Puccinia graminis f. sp. tritici]